MSSTVTRSRPARPIRVDSGGRIPPGGTTGQALVKSSGNDYATEWGTATASAAWGAIAGTLSDQTDLQTALNGKAETSSLSAIATSGSASDLSAGTLPAAQLPDFGSGDVSFASGGGAGTIAAKAVTNAKMADMDTARIKGRATVGTGEPEDLTGAQVLAMLPVPGASGELIFNNDAAFGASADAEIEDGQLRLPYIATPATPAAGGVKLYGEDFGPGTLAFLRPDGVERLLQSDLGHFNINRWVAQVGLNAFTGEHSLNTTNIGTLTAATPAVTDLHRMMPRLDLLVTVAAATAIAGWRPNGAASRFLRVGKDANAPGGFLVRQIWGPATGVSTATTRGFCGVADWSAAPTDVEPSSRTNIIGMGWDAADANIKFMHNDGAGTATKIDLGAGFPVPTVDRNEVYEVQLYSPNSLTRSVSYRVIRYSRTDKTIAAEAIGTITTDLPAVTTLLGAVGAMSVGGTSSVVGVAVMGILTAREY